ncbi:MAG: tyrosine-type recombinase/integrase [Lachnospira sp.]
MSRKGENIRKRKDGRWEGRYKKGNKEDGSILYGSVYGKTYREVRRKMQIAIATPQSLKMSDSPSEMTFSELLTLWQETNEIRLKGGTKTKYSNLIDTHIIPSLGSMRVTEITVPVINAFLSDRLQRGRLDGKGGLSPSYVRSISLVISSAMKYAVNEDICKPLKNKICKPSVIKGELPILTLESQRLLESIIVRELTPTRVGIMISLYTGLRIGEVCALAWSDIDFTNCTIYVRHTISRVKAGTADARTELILDEPKTVSSKRIIPIPSPLLPILLEYRNHSKSAFVVSDKDSFVSPRTYESRFHKVLNDCHIEDINYHALRHTFATRCIEAGVDVKSLSEILGHSNVSITLNTYVHSSLEMKKSQLEKLTLLPA